MNNPTPFDPYAPPQSTEPDRGVDRRGAWRYALIGTPIFFFAASFIGTLLFVFLIGSEMSFFDWVPEVMQFISMLVTAWAWRSHLDKRYSGGVTTAVLLTMLPSAAVMTFLGDVIAVMTYVGFHDTEESRSPNFVVGWLLFISMFNLIGLVGLLRFRRRSSEIS